ncbi:MAG: tetratricopeptide repeat protein [Candidatus Latescibacteria bacterium]|nr:tetratricopeptide repeat protein [Candidatus Latescibacterota bacterium]
MKQAIALGPRAGAAIALALVSACGQGKTAGKSPAPTLAQQLSTMPAEDQLAFLKDLERQKPGDATVAFHLGNTYYSMGSALPADENSQALAYYDSAVTAYARAVEIDSAYSKAYVNMGLAYDAATKRADARRVLRKAIEVNPNDVLAYCHLGQIEQGYGDYAEAIRLYQKALVIDPNSAQAHYNLGLAFAEKKLFKEALVEWETVIALDPGGELGKTATENVRIIRQYLEAAPK